MTTATAEIRSHEIAIEIGGVPLLLRTCDASFRELLEERYSGFVGSSRSPRLRFDIDLVDSVESTPDDVEVTKHLGLWSLRRGDFRAEWDAAAGKGWIRQSANPYSIDSVLRIVHSVILSQEGGFLLHSASAIRNGKAFLFSGVSGAGKTTISRLDPSDVTLLTDEVSYVRPSAHGYEACGTPFAGELARVGENCSAPLSTLFFLEQGSENRIAPIHPSDAVRSLLRNILFFAENDPELVHLLFRTVFQFVERVPVCKLTFLPDSRVWDLIA